ncbi:hypothetical protein FA041_04505 [Escherichia coli]|nr:hypothetical protein [Escherichia coli]
MMAWNAGEYCHQQPALQSRAVAQLLAWLNERYPFTQFHISRQIYMGVWDSLLYEGFHWLSASREPRRWQIPLVLIP